ncbi:MAG TPA: S9 family peptidase, partial [Sphingomicrobium sp.]|nr:S9 family peptidase [Sphingomicrobium sp.]
MKRFVVAAAVAAAVPAYVHAQTAPQVAAAPPVAEQKPYTVKGPKDRNDPYYWLRDDTRKDPKMLAYLKAENAYADALLADTKPLQEKLFNEIVSRIKQDDSSVPARQRGYWYYSRFETGGDYPIIARKEGTVEAPEKILLNIPAMAKGHGFFQIGEWMVSQDNALLAYAEDTVGRRQYVLKVKNIASGEALADTVQNVEPN